MATISEQFDEAVRSHQCGDFAQAEALYQLVIQAEPGHVAASFNLGAILKAQRRLEEAACCFRRVVAHDPGNFRAHFQLGNVLKDQGLSTEAAQCYRETLTLNPQHADACNNLGILLRLQGQKNEAADCYRQALRINPQHADAMHNLGVIFSDDRQWADAVSCFRQAASLNPDLSAVHVHLANALCQQGNLEDAIVSYRQALRLEPNNADAHHNLATALRDLGMFDEAEVHYEEAARLLPGNPAVRFNRAHLQLLKGDFASAWEGYEKRWSLPGKQPRAFTQPRWDGTPFPGKTLLVYAEGGLGDSIQFSRYMARVKKCGGSVVFECQAALLGLFADLAGVDVLVAGTAESLPPFDLHIPLLSLPGIFQTTLATIPAAKSYLRADSGLVEAWKKELDRAVANEHGGVREKSARRVGIAWQGNPENKGDYYRSLPLALFEPLTRIEGVTLVSLQAGPGAEQVREVAFPIIDLGSRFSPTRLDDLAAAMRSLDLVITVETAVAHLAALGVPVWTLLSVSPDWRWLLDRSDSPWYPTMRLFRQDRFGDWKEVICRVAEALRFVV